MTQDNNDKYTNALNYFAFVVEDRMGLSSDITKMDNSIEVRLHEEANITPEEAHIYCMEYFTVIFNEWGIFIPFKVYDQEGNMVTCETYYSGVWGDVDNVTPFDLNLSPEDDEEFYNFG